MHIIIIFFIVFLFNLIPAFSPPTWMLLAYAEVRYHPHALVLALVGAIAATLGRLLLAKLSRLIVRDRFLSAGTIKNIDAVKEKLSEHKHVSFSIFLFYAFSPFPSNQLFLAYGLTDLPLSLITLPFLIGRFFSYLFWVMVASEAVKHIAVDTLQKGSFFKTYFIIVQILTLGLVYLFIKIDWHKLFAEHKLGWMKK